MRSTVDGAGRVVIPKAIRDELGWQDGVEVAFEVTHGKVVITAATKGTAVDESAASGDPEVDLPQLTGDAIEWTLRSLR
jgi:AbrB family looped-hinge helix DNA binding protein